jgi:hypothetical protein
VCHILHVQPAIRLHWQAVLRFGRLGAGVRGVQCSQLVCAVYQPGGLHFSISMVQLCVQGCYSSSCSLVCQLSMAECSHATVTNLACSRYSIRSRHQLWWCCMLLTCSMSLCAGWRPQVVCLTNLSCCNHMTEHTVQCDSWRAAPPHSLSLTSVSHRLCCFGVRQRVPRCFCCL